MLISLRDVGLVNANYISPSNPAQWQILGPAIALINSSTE